MSTPRDSSAPRSVDQMVIASYPELKRLAAQALIGETLRVDVSPTMLVNDAYTRLRRQHRIAAAGETFFKRCFAREFRRIVIDTIRARRAQKRGGAAVRVTLSECGSQLGVASDDRVLEVHEALERLQQLGERGERVARVVEMRVFGDMTVVECATELGVAPRTIDQDWAFGLAWLRCELGAA